MSFIGIRFLVWYRVMSVRVVGSRWEWTGSLISVGLAPGVSDAGCALTYVGQNLRINTKIKNITTMAASALRSQIMVRPRLRLRSCSFTPGARHSGPRHPPTR